MKTYTPGEVATAIGVSASSIRNWTEQEEVQEFLSDLAVRRGASEHAKQREYTLQDLYVMNTLAKNKTRHNSWNDIAEILRAGELDTDMPPSAALVMQDTAAEGFADKIILRQKVEFLEKTVREQEQEIDRLRGEVVSVREEERNVSKEERREFQSTINDLNRLIGKMEAQIEMLKDQINDEQ